MQLLGRNAFDMLNDEKAGVSGVCCGIAEIDRILGGMSDGLSTGSITEFVGHAGAGKSQLCHQFVSNLLLRGSRPFYIDTEGSFSTKRLLQMLGGDEKITLLENLFCERCTDHDGLLTILRKLDLELEKKSEACAKVRLLIVDSVAHVVKGLELDIYREALNKIGIELSKIARRGIAVLVTNHVVDEIDEAFENSWIKAALPSWWAHRVAIRLWVERISTDSKTRRLALTKSPYKPMGYTTFTIEVSGIIALSDADFKVLLNSEEAYQSILNRYDV